MVGLHAEVVEHEVVALLGEQAQDDGLAEGARHGGYADVHLPARDALRDAAVLGQPPLGDVEARDQLDARRHGGEAVHRLRQPGVQHAVEAHAHGERIFGRLDVDVGRAEVHGLGQQVVDQFDDRGLLRQVAQVLRLVAGEQVLHRAFLAHVVEGAVEVVVRGEAEADGGRGGGDAGVAVLTVGRVGGDAGVGVLAVGRVRGGRVVGGVVAAGVVVAGVVVAGVVAGLGVAGVVAGLGVAGLVEVLQGLRHPVVRDVAGEAVDLLVLLPHEDGIVEKPLELDRGRRHEAVHVERVRQVVGVGEIERADLLRQRAQQHVFGDGAGADQERAETAAHGALDLQRTVDVGLLHGVALDQHLAEAPAGAVRRLCLLRSLLLL